MVFRVLNFENNYLYLALMGTASFCGGPEAAGRHERYSVKQKLWLLIFPILVPYKTKKHQLYN
jgi:hypothetical protein